MTNIFIAVQAIIFLFSGKHFGGNITTLVYSLLISYLNYVGPGPALMNFQLKRNLPWGILLRGTGSPWAMPSGSEIWIGLGLLSLNLRVPVASSTISCWAKLNVMSINRFCKYSAYCWSNLEIVPPPLWHYSHKSRYSLLLIIVKSYRKIIIAMSIRVDSF